MGPTLEHVRLQQKQDPDGGTRLLDRVDAHANAKDHQTLDAKEYVG